MDPIRRRALGAGLTLALAGGALHAQTTPIRFVVPFPPGGAADQVARLVAQEVAAALGNPVVVENRAGAGGMIAAELVARAAPDGRTFFVGSNGPLVFNSALYAKMPYDPEKAFAPVAGLSRSPLLLVTRRDLGAANVADLIAAGRRDAPRLTMASAGVGNITHLAGEYASALMGFKVTHVPFPGSAPAIANLAGGHVDIMFDALPSSVQQAREGLIRPLAILDDQRFPPLPAVPTLRELGYANIEIGAWKVLVAPAQTPRQAVLDMNRTVNEVLRRPEVVQRLQAIGEQPMPGSPEDLGRFVAAERERWIPLVRSLGIKAD
jgi:tripartite-type tricarboxylate transporter receptor subunit TctC